MFVETQNKPEIQARLNQVKTTNRREKERRDGEREERKKDRGIKTEE